LVLLAFPAARLMMILKWRWRERRYYNKNPAKAGFFN
jgi:hypothetical protein